ncbi:MAG: gliding motility-associated C-terminal domain-containing protein [Flavobacteriales bacterium]
MKKLIFLSVLFLGLSFSVKSSHAVGGDIQFIQTGANSYDVTMRLFRYCTGAGLGTSYSIRILDQVTCASVQTVQVTRISQNSIPFGDECYTPPGLCVEEHVYTGTIASLPNNSNGYMTTWSLCCRNAIVNMNGGSLGLYTKIPDPALTAGNSTPRFVDYPRDGYFCINQLKCIDFSATDTIDGDSLSYELVNPINTFTGCTPNLLAFQASYNMTNILGPGSSCTIDSKTGCVWARPAALGIYVISVKCSEWRNGVKIGEVVRDIQYSALNCNYNELPDYYSFEDVKTLQFDENGCFDLVAFDRDPEDTFLIDILSDAYPFGAIATLPTPNSLGKYDFEWKNPTTGNTDTVTNVNVKKLTSTKFEGVGRIGVRFCWTPDNCEILSIDTFNINMFGYSLGCDGSVDSIERNVKVVIDRPLPKYVVPNVFSPNDDGINDEFKLEQGSFDRCYDALSVKIYNRWGQKVYESEEALFKWNGRDESGNELVEGTYFVVLQGYYGGKEVTQNFPLTLFR